MKISRTVWIAIAALLLWLLFSWMLGGWIGLQAPRLYYLRGGLWILGIIGFVGFLILRPKDAGGPAAISSGEVDDNFAEATKRLQASGVKQLASLPAVFFLGDSDSAKTSVIARSDIAQLVAGQALQGVTTVPTRAVNFWIAKNTIFVDPAGALMADEANRKRLFKKFSSVALKSVMGSRKLPARSVVFTVDCGIFLQKGGAEAAAAKARQFQAVLAELAQEIGSSFPVYVLFTKADKITYFRDFVENLNEQEAADVLGITMPLESEQGVYAEHQTKRLVEAFQQLYYSLAERRVIYLAREHKPVALPNIYEFPREFNKLRSLLTSFLVDLCRPSQLGISPFLRGFYFTGIRAKTVNDVAPAAGQPVADDGGSDPGATRMFQIPPRGAPIVPEGRESSARKVAQWVFLPHLLPAVILADGTVNRSGESNVKLNVARRILLGAATAAALVMATWWIISFTNNRALVNGALEAANRVPLGEMASLESLQELSKVKDSLATLNHFEEDGRPLSYGAFLYTGDDARESVRKAYYGLFRRLLLTPTQEKLVQVCNSPNGLERQLVYEDLKSYLITTSRHDHSADLSIPTLLQNWGKDHSVGSSLARENFEFYKREIGRQSDYLPLMTPDGGAVESCRDYLNKFGQTERIYQEMLNDARGNGKQLIFNVDYPGSEATVVNRFPVDLAFSKAGSAAFEKLLKNPQKYYSGDEWVLGEKSREGLDTGKLVPELRSKYQSEFADKWLKYLEATRVLQARSVTDAVAKLEVLSGSRSPLLQALCVAGENTANVEAFQPVQVITPQGCRQALAASVGPYMGKLVALQEALKLMDQSKPETYTAAKNAAIDAETVVKSMALSFKGPTDEVVKKLLLAPIYHVGDAPEPEISAANDAASRMCEEISPLLEKYPFKAGGPDASLEELDKFLKKPDGFLWKLKSDPAVKKYISELGDSVGAATTTGKHHATPQFISFLKKAIGLSHVLYGPGGQTAGFTFSMKSVASPDVEHVTLIIDGQTLADTRSNAKEFPWPGNPPGLEMKIRFVGGSDITMSQNLGLWGIWHSMDSAHQVGPQEFEWVSMVGNVPAKTSLGNPEAIRFTVDPASAAEVLRPHYFEKMSCVSKAVN